MGIGNTNDIAISLDSKTDLNVSKYQFRFKDRSKCGIFGGRVPDVDTFE